MLIPAAEVARVANFLSLLARFSIGITGGNAPSSDHTQVQPMSQPRDRTTVYSIITRSIRPSTATADASVASSSPPPSSSSSSGTASRASSFPSVLWVPRTSANLESLPRWSHPCYTPAVVAETGPPFPDTPTDCHDSSGLREVGQSLRCWTDKRLPELREDISDKTSGCRKRRSSTGGNMYDPHTRQILEEEKECIYPDRRDRTAQEVLQAVFFRLSAAAAYTENLRDLEDDFSQLLQHLTEESRQNSSVLPTLYDTLHHDFHGLYASMCSVQQNLELQCGQDVACVASPHVVPRKFRKLAGSGRTCARRHYNRMVQVVQELVAVSIRDIEAKLDDHLECE